MRPRKFTFDEMVSRSPALATAAADARTIAANARSDWFPKWLPRSRVFQDTVYRAADELGLTVEAVHSVALAGLLREYSDARRIATAPPPPAVSPCKPRGWRAPKPRQFQNDEDNEDDGGYDGMEAGPLLEKPGRAKKR